MNRRLDWPEQMAAAVHIATVRPFEWGVQDCALFTCNVVLAMTDTDLAARFRGKYTTPHGAYRLLKKICGGGLSELAEQMAKKHGCAEVPWTFARRGDVVLIPVSSGENSEALGICDGQHTLVANRDGGLLRLPISQALKVWRI